MEPQFLVCNPVYCMSLLIHSAVHNQCGPRVRFIPMHCNQVYSQGVVRIITPLRCNKSTLENRLEIRTLHSYMTVVVHEHASHWVSMWPQPKPRILSDVLDDHFSLLQVIPINSREKGLKAAAGICICVGPILFTTLMLWEFKFKKA